MGKYRLDLHFFITINLILIFSLFFHITGIKAQSHKLPELQFYETSVASNFGNGCEYEAVYTMKYKPFRSWRLADNVAYVLWQKSENGGVDWDNINGQSGVNKDELKIMVEGTENLIFRAIVVADSNEASAKRNAEYIAANGVSADASVKYTISKPLSSMKPEATCEYDPDYLCTRYETFGLCSTHSCRYDTAIKVNKYIPGGSEEMTWGQYILCSNPDSAIYTKDCEDCPRKYQFSSVKDADGNIIDSSATSKLIPEYIGDAFAFIMMSKEEYKKIPRLFSLFSGVQPLCQCKDYVFYTFISCVGAPSGTRLYPKLTVLDPRNGDTLATQTYYYTYKGFELNKPTLQFTPPTDYNNEGFLGIIELDYESANSDGEKMSDHVIFSMDECAFSVCGVRVPSHGSCVDKKPFHILSNGFYCRMDEGNRVGEWIGYEEWRYRHPDAAFLWQRKNTPDSPWESLTAEKDTFFTYSWEDGEYHPTYRVLLAESADVIRQELENVFPDDPCAIRTEPYALGFYCTEYVCPKTKFSFVQDDEKVVEEDTIVSFKRNEDIKIVLYQNDSESIDAFYAKGSDTPIISESSGRIHTLYLPAVDSTFVIYAMNDTCYTDSVFFSITKICPDTKFSFVKGDLTAVEYDTTVCHNRSESVKFLLYQNDDEDIDAFYIKGNSKSLVCESVGRTHTLHIPAIEGEFVIYAKNDTCITDSVYITIRKDGKVEFENIDDSGTREIVVEAKGGTCNYTYDFGEGFQKSNTLTDITYGKKYKISVKDEDGCRADTLFQTNRYDIVVSPTVTPNGDGVNDKFEIKGIEKYPEAEITLYDRTGKKLLSTTGEKFDGWDGTYLGRPLPTTDYWYEIYVPELNKTYLGHFTLYRE